MLLAQYSVLEDQFEKDAYRASVAGRTSEAMGARYMANAVNRLAFAVQQKQLGYYPGVAAGIGLAETIASQVDYTATITITEW